MSILSVIIMDKIKKVNYKLFKGLGSPYCVLINSISDMPAHLKASLLGSSLNIPIGHGRLNLGTWQGIYLCEHRNHGGSRAIVVTINGE
jgi:thiamine phosphate synthase YjbQ (UPF0047 family)